MIVKISHDEKRKENDILRERDENCEDEKYGDETY